MNKTNYNYFFYILLYLVFSHFIPFNRASLSPDDYALINLPINGFKNFFLHSDRPILYMWLELQYSILKNDTNLYFYLLIISSYLVSILTFILFNIFFENKKSFVITIIYLVLVYNIEMYQNSIMIHINLVTSLYLISLILLLKSKDSNLSYFFSILFYSIAIFWYEIGFFTPFAFLFLKLRYPFNSRLKILIPFIILMLIYSINRLTGLFGIFELNSSHSITFNFISSIIEVFNHFFGRYFFKNLIYGYYQFFKMPYYFIIVLISFNFLSFYLIRKKLLIFQTKNNIKSILFFIFLFIFSLIPVILNGQAGGRNLIIPTISVAFFIYFFLFEYLKQKKLVNIFIVIFLVASQGNAFSQYVSSNIHFSILSKILNDKNEINKVDYFLFDASSLSKNIKHSLVNNQYNIINTYYGSQVWETWGIKGFVNSIKSNKNLETLILVENPEYTENGLNIKYIKNQKYKYIGVGNKHLEKNNIYLLNFNTIYNDNYYNGLINK